jgi:phosphoglucomutase
MIHPLAGKPPDPSTLVSREEMERVYRDPPSPLLPVKNGTSGHRGRTGAGFSERHVAAMTQALVDLRRERGTFGPAFPPGLPVTAPGAVVVGKDVRFTSDFAEITAIEVFAGNGVPVIVNRGFRSTPTPVVSHTILAGRKDGERIEGVVITASHNPPDDAGYKSNGMDGGPNTRTAPVDEIANRYLSEPSGIRRISIDAARRQGLIIERDLVEPYVNDLGSVVRFDAIRGLRFAASPLGGSANGYYEAIDARWGTRIDVVLGEPDPACAHRTCDWDGRLRGDPSSEWVMAAVEPMRAALGVPFLGANDNDADRFGGVDKTGILQPNHALCVLFDHLCRTRGFDAARGIGRTIGTTHMLDQIAQSFGRPVHEVPVGFKWYVEGLASGRYVLAGEESAGLCFPRFDGRTWVTEKDGLAAVLLIMEVVATTGKDVGTRYRELEERYGPHPYERVDTAATPEKKARLAVLASDRAEVERRLSGRRVAGRSIERITVGDGVKVVLEGGVWVLKRASGTEDVIKDYREARGLSLDPAREASADLDLLLGLAR